MTNKKKDSLFSRIKGKLFSSDDDEDFEIVEDEIDPSELDDYESRYHTEEGEEGFEAYDDDLSDEEREAILRQELGEDYTPVINEELIAGSETIPQPESIPQPETIPGMESSLEQEVDEDATDPSFVLSEDVQETEADQVDENLQFPEMPEQEDSEFADDADEDEVFEALEAETSVDLGEPEIEEEDEEEFVPQPMTLSEEDKEEIEDEMDELEEEFPEMPQEMPKPEPTREIDLAQMQASEEYEEVDYDEYDEEHGDFDEFQVPGQKAGIKGKIAGVLSSLKSKIPGGGGGGGGRPPFVPKKPSRIKLPEGFDWDAIYNKIFDPATRPAIHRGFLALLFAVSTYGMGKMAALTLKGDKSPSVASSTNRGPKVAYFAKPEMDTVANTDLFNAPGEIAKDPCKENPSLPGCGKKPIKKKDEKKVCVASNTESNLGLKLVNTLVLQDTVKSIASVQVRNAKEVLSFREGDKIKNMATIGRINRQKMVFKNLKTGECEYIANVDKNLKKMAPLTILSPKKGKKLLQKDKSGIQNAGNSYKIPNKVREQMLANISEVLTQARAVQINNPDGTLSFKLTEIVPNSIYSKLDIQNDDIIKSINGKPIKNINEVMTLFGNIRQIDHFELGILRNGAEVNKEYDFE